MLFEVIFYVLLAIPIICGMAIAVINTKKANKGKYMSKRELRQLQYLLEKFENLDN